MKENPLTMEMLRSARRTEHYSTCCNSLILLVITEWIHHYSKKDYYDSLDTISATFIGLVNVAISAVLK
jgi:hypothetical protein